MLPCGNQTSGACCPDDLRALVWHLNRHIGNLTRHDPEKQVNADLYTVVILCLFASTILLLMVRAIRPSETLDDQVAIMLSSMRVRVEREDNDRQRRKMREAKRRAQRWLAEAKMKSFQRLAFTPVSRKRSTSNSTTVEQASLKSNPAMPTFLAKPRPMCQRAASYNFLPQIVVSAAAVPPVPERASSMEVFDGAYSDGSKDMLLDV